MENNCFFTNVIFTHLDGADATMRSIIKRPRIILNFVGILIGFDETPFLLQCIQNETSPV